MLFRLGSQFAEGDRLRLAYGEGDSGEEVHWASSERRFFFVGTSRAGALALFEVSSDMTPCSCWAFLISTYGAQISDKYATRFFCNSAARFRRS